MICDGFRIPMFFPVMDGYSAINQLQIFKLDKEFIDKKSNPILNIIRDGDHYSYKNRNNDNCIITYDTNKTDNSSEYNCKVVDSTFGTYEECVSASKNSILFETYKNEKPTFYYERVDDDFECAINGKRAEVIMSETGLIIIDNWDNYFIFNSKFCPLPDNIIEEGIIQDGKFIPTLEYGNFGNNLLNICNRINHNSYFVYLD